MAAPIWGAFVKYRKTLTMTVFNRPAYLRKVLGALSRCLGIERYRLVICAEPGCDEVLELVRAVTFAPVEVVLNKEVLTCPVNVYQALRQAFLETDFNIHLEDDILLWKDALTYFEHCRKAYQDDRNVFTVTAYNNQASGPKERYGLARRAWFTPWAWATWADRFEEMRPHWDFNYAKGNWDHNLNTAVRGERVEVFPILARAQNIGLTGVHVPSEQWGKAFHYNEFWAGKVNPAGDQDWRERPDWTWEPFQAKPEDLKGIPGEWLKALGVPVEGEK